MIPATRSAIPSDMYTPLKPRKCVSAKHSGIKMTTLRFTASRRAAVPCPRATLIFCSVICTKNMIEPIKNSGVYCFTIAVTESGALFWNDEPATRQLLESRLSVEAQKSPQPPVNIRGDKTTPYRLINDVVKIAQAQGIAKVGFVTTPPKKGQ